MNLFTKLKKLFSKENRLTSGGITYNLIYQNDNLRIVSDACSICYNNNKERTYEERADYIRRRIASGHESILEHSNGVVRCTFKNNELNMKYLVELLPTFRYLNVITDVGRNNEIDLLLCGSIRGFKHIIRECKHSDNLIYKSILKSLYGFNSCYFEDFIKDDIMIKNNFCDMVNDLDKLPDYNKTNKVNIVSEDITKLTEVLNFHVVHYVKLSDLLNMATITVLFKGVSRTASHQLVRHRAGITQLSQRYTDSSNLNFINPCDFKPEKYDNAKLYKLINLSNNKSPILKTSKDLGDMLMGIYPQLIEEGMLKEDARSFLPSNVETSLYMTFTFKGLLKFLQLRTDPAAQAEIRSLACELDMKVKDIFDRYGISYDLLKPQYELIAKDMEENLDIDEIIED